MLHAACGIRNSQRKIYQAMSAGHNRKMKCVATDGGILETLLLEQVGVNNGNFIKSDLSFKLIK